MIHQKLDISDALPGAVVEALRTSSARATAQEGRNETGCVIELERFKEIEP